MQIGSIKATTHSSVAVASPINSLMWHIIESRYFMGKPMLNDAIAQWFMCVNQSMN